MQASIPNVLGRHLLADFSGVAKVLLTDSIFLETLLREAALAADAVPLFSKFHHFGEGLGVTGVLLLQESHISIHTWPEYGFAAVDVFMCGACRPEVAIDVIEKGLMPAHLSVKDELRSGVFESRIDHKPSL